MSAEERIMFDEVKAALAAEQREHWNTRTQLSALQDEIAEERRINNAALKPSAKVLQQDQEDEMACIAEEVEGLKYRLIIATEYGNTLLNETKELNQKIEALELVEVALRTDVSLLKVYKVELESSAETQATHMKQMEAACKAAEAKVQEQRKEIEDIKRGEDMWICPSANCCTKTHCPDNAPHKRNTDCGIVCKIVSSGGVKIDKCALCESKQQEEIEMRDAIILQYESRAEDREEIIKALAKEIKVIAPTTGTYTIMFSGKAGEMQDNKCKYYYTCRLADKNSHTCTNGGGEYCGTWRDCEASL